MNEVDDIQKELGSAAKGVGEDLNKQLDETGKKLKITVQIPPCRKKHFGDASGEELHQP
jgi:hypothetical protein